MVDDASLAADGDRISAVFSAAVNEHYDRAGCREGILFAYPVPHFGRRVFGAHH